MLWRPIWCSTKTHSIAATGLILPALRAVTRPRGSATRISRPLRRGAGGRLVNLSEGRVGALSGHPRRDRSPQVSGSSLVLGYGVCEGLNAPNSFLVRQLIANPPSSRAQQCLHRNVAAAAVVGLLLGGVSSCRRPLWVFLAVRRRGTRGVGLLLDVASPRRSARGGDLGVLRRRPAAPALRNRACGRVSIRGIVLLRRELRGHASRDRQLDQLERRGPLGPRVGVAHRRDPRSARGAKDPRPRALGEVQRLCYFGAGMGIAAMALAEVLAGSHSRTSDIVAIVATIPIGFASL